VELTGFAHRKIKEPQNTQNTRKQNLTVQRSVSVCSVYSVVRKSDNDARQLDMLPPLVSAPIREPKSGTMVGSDSLPFLSDKAS
jgi:hypothetical protein